MALPNLWGLCNLRSSPYFQATLRSDTEATPLNLLVGRERERQLLLTTIGSSRSSRQAVAGRPGIAKTTLVQAVKADAKDAGYWTSAEIMSLGREGSSEGLLGRLLFGISVWLGGWRHPNRRRVNTTECAGSRWPTGAAGPVGLCAGAGGPGPGAAPEQP